MIVAAETMNLLRRRACAELAGPLELWGMFAKPSRSLLSTGHAVDMQLSCKSVMPLDRRLLIPEWAMNRYESSSELCQARRLE